MVAKCGYCGATGTKLVVIEPLGAPFRVGAVSCGRCGAVLGVTGLHDEGAMLMQQAERLEALRRGIVALERQVEGLHRELERIETRLQHRPPG